MPEIDEPLLNVMVPAAGVNVPETLKIPATVAVWVPAVTVPLMVKLL